MIQRLFFGHRPDWILPLFRVLYPLALLYPLLIEMPSIFARADSQMCYPIPIFKLLSLPIIPSSWMPIIFWLLIGSLLSLSVGLATRVSAATATFLFFWVIGSTISCASGPNPDYTPWHQAIVVFNLLILAVAPCNQRFSLDRSFWQISPAESLNWPILLLKFNLAFAYFAGGIAKLRHGLDWMNGYSLQAHLIYTHLHIDTPAVLPLLKYHELMVAISVIVVVAEIVFPLALISRFMAIVCIAGSLAFQLLFYYLIDLRWMPYFGWSYLIYAVELIALVALHRGMKNDRFGT